MATKRVNIGKLHAVLDQRRIALGLSWRDVAAETGLHPSTFSRMAQNRAPDADAIATLCWWAMLDIRDYV